MQATKTRFGLYDEPELLPTNRISTAPEFDQLFQLVIDNIDEVLAEPNQLGIYPDLTRRLQQTTLANWLEPITHPRPQAWALSAIEDFLAQQRDSHAAHLTQPAAKASSPAQRLDANLGDIQLWLGVGLDKAAALAGISRGTVYAWRARGSNPRPATTAAVARLHGLVAAAFKVVGDEPARSWFHTGEPSPLDQLLQAAGDPARMGVVSARLRRELLRLPVPPANRALAATADDIAE